MTEPSTAPTAPSHSSNTSQLPVPPPPPSTATTAPSNSSNTKNTGRKNTNDPPHPNQPLGYRDCASIGPAASEEMFAPVPGDRNNFPVQLHLLLSILEAEGLAYIVSWKPHGRCFAMHQLTAMEQIVLPRYVPTCGCGRRRRRMCVFVFRFVSFFVKFVRDDCNVVCLIPLVPMEARRGEAHSFIHFLVQQQSRSLFQSSFYFYYFVRADFFGRASTPRSSAN